MDDGTAAARTAEDPRVLVLVSAAWSVPSRPAPTVLRELARRPGAPVRGLLLEDPERAVLDELGVSVLPTWLVLGPAADRPGGDVGGPGGRSDGGPGGRSVGGPDPDDGGPEGCDGAERHADPDRAAAERVDAVPVDADPVITDLTGLDAAGEPTRLRGRWRELRRAEGALPKHAVAALVEQDAPTTVTARSEGPGPAPSPPG